MNNQLKPCPFCGGEAFMKSTPLMYEFPMCGKCGVTKGCPAEWNTRAPVKCIHIMMEEFAETFNDY